MPAPLITVLDAANQPLGPFPLEEVQRRIYAGEFRGDQLAYAEGLKAWTPLSQVIAHVQALASPAISPAPIPPPAIASGTVAPAAVKPTPLITPSPLPGSAVPAAPQAGVAAGVPGIYAGFWLRFWAYLIDSIILSVASSIPISILLILAAPAGFWQGLGSGNAQAMDQEPSWVNLLSQLFSFALFFSYFSLMESSQYQGTVGKIVLGLKVTDMNGQRLTLGRALARTAGKIVSSLTCCVFGVGYMMAGFTAHKQALHDLIASTLVYRR